MAARRSVEADWLSFGMGKTRTGVLFPVPWAEGSTLGIRRNLGSCGEILQGGHSEVGARLESRGLIRRGRGKIERFFRTVNQRFLCHLAGYMRAGRRRSGTLLTLAELDARLAEMRAGAEEEVSLADVRRRLGAMAGR